MTSPGLDPSRPLVISTGLAALFGLGSIWLPTLLGGVFPLASVAALEGIRRCVRRLGQAPTFRTKIQRTLAPLGVFAASGTLVLLAPDVLGPLRGPILGLAALVWFVPGRNGPSGW